jgi:hypothetical protein
MFPWPYFRMHSPTGVCQHYNGICSARLNSTEHRYINSSLGMNETERVAVRILKAVESIYDGKAKDNSCKEILKKTACFFVFPFCSAQDTKLDYCREDCNYLFEICGSGLNRVSFVKGYTRIRRVINRHLGGAVSSHRES